MTPRDWRVRRYYGLVPWHIEKRHAYLDPEARIKVVKAVVATAAVLLLAQAAIFSVLKVRVPRAT